MNPQQNNTNTNQMGPQVIMPTQGAQGPQGVQSTQGISNQQSMGQQIPPQPTTGQVMGQQVSPQPTMGQQMNPQQVAGQAAGQQLGPQQVAGQAAGQQLSPQQAPNQAMPNTGAGAGGSQVLEQNASNVGAKTLKANQNAPVSPVKESPTSTQSTLLISELRDNVVIMKDGSYRAVVACKSINFDLMSDAERESVEYSYQNFLNSLKFNIQILVRSQKVDIGPYIEKLSEIRRNNDNMLLGVLMDDYINFIDVLSQEANIMDKSFFIVVPYYSSPDAEKVLNQTKNFFKSFSKNKGIEVTRIDRATYDKAMSEITNRVDSVMSGLFQIGIHAVRLNTKELAELYYNFNNPDTAIREPLVDFSKLATLYVRKGERGAQNG